MLTAWPLVNSRSQAKDTFIQNLGVLHAYDNHLLQKRQIITKEEYNSIKFYLDRPFKNLIDKISDVCVDTYSDIFLSHLY